MRNLKKVLSLVMAMVMTMSLATVALADTATTTTAATTSTATFSDASSIKNTAAVTLLNSLGVLKGSNGAFNPASTLTRAEAAKIICYVLVGTDVASTLDNSAVTTSFTDMTNAAWANGYVQYCSSLGIINGYGDGKFGPNDKVTTYQFAKMLLVGLGYGVNKEFTGANWATNVAVKAIALGVLPKGTTNVDLTRDNAALYAYNTLFADLVTYNNDKSTYDKKDGDGNTIGTLAANNFNYGEQVAKLRFDAAKGYYVDVDDNSSYTANKDILVTNTDPNLVNQNVSIQAIGTTAMSAATAKDITLATFTDGKFGGRVVSYNSTNFVAAYASAVTVVINGTPTPYTISGTVTADPAANGTYVAGADFTSNGVSVLKGDIFTESTNVVAHDTTTRVYSSVASGSVVSLIDSVTKQTVNNKTQWLGDGAIDKVVITNKASSKLTAAPTVDSNGYVTISAAGITTQKNVVYPTGLVKDDVVLSYLNNATNTYYVEKATSITGVITSVNTGLGQVTVAGTTYNLAPTPISVAAAYTALASKSATVYLDNNSNAVYVTSTAATTTLANYVFVTNATTGGTFGTDYYAAVTFMDGTTATAKVTKVDGSDAAGVDVTAPYVAAAGVIAKNTFYTFTKDSSGNYILTAVASGQQNAYTTTLAGGTVASGDTTYQISKNTVQFLTKLTATAATWTGATSVAAAPSPVATSATAFIYKGTTSNTVYTGIANVPAAVGSTTGNDVYILNDANGYTLAVYSALTSSASAANDVVYVKNTNATTVYNTDGTVNYYTYDVIKDGAATTLKTTSPSTFGVTVGLYQISAYTTDGYASSVVLAPSSGLYHYDADATTKLEVVGGVLNVDGAYYNTSSSTVYYRLYKDANGGVVCESVTADSLKNLDLTKVNAVLAKETSPTDSTISAVYVVNF